MPTSSPSTTDRVLDAAERLLRQGDPGFSMRDLAAEAGVSFATPFNRFGSKGALMLALSARRIDEMESRLSAARLPDDAASRVLAAARIAAGVMLEAPEVNRAVMAALGAPGVAPTAVSTRSQALWAMAIAEGRGLAPSLKPLALASLPGHLAIGFRGVLSFWTAGEIADGALAPRAESAAAAALLGFAGTASRGQLLAVLSRA